MDLSIVSTDPNDPYARIRRQGLPNLGPPPPQIAGPGQMGEDVDLGIPSALNKPPKVEYGGRGSIAGDKAELARLKTSGPGDQQIYSKITHSDFGQNHPLASKIIGGISQGAATIGDIGLSTVAPSLAINTPGTELHHRMLENRATRAVASDESNAQKEAETANQQAETGLHEAQTEAAKLITISPEQAQAMGSPELAGQQVTQGVFQHMNTASKSSEQKLRAQGYKIDENGAVVPMGRDELSAPQQAEFDRKAAQSELADATAELRRTQADPNSAAHQLALQRIQIASQRLALSNKTYNARYLGTDAEGHALPGAMLTEDGTPVGSTFSQNVRPTGQERNKGDMAASADRQIDDMLSIIQKRPDIFGPAAGRKTDFTVWLGSQDPDAQRFRAARTIAGDHLAGTFGGRSEAALDALDKAIGQFKDNPAAVTSGLEQLKEANHLFLEKGTVHSAKGGEAGPKGGQTAPKFKVKLSDAMALPQNKGKSEADVEADVKKHGGEVVR